MNRQLMLSLIMTVVLALLFVAGCGTTPAEPVAEAPVAEAPPPTATLVPATATPTPQPTSPASASKLPHLLSSVWGSSSSDVFAVAFPGAILHYDGAAWSPMDSGKSYRLAAVWGSSSSDVFATGDSGKILHYDGSVWSSMNSGTVKGIWGVWGSSGRDVFAVGDGGTILHYDGSSWTPMKSGTYRQLMTSWGSSSSDVFAVGTLGLILHYDGKVWSPMNSGTIRNLWGVWGSSGQDVFAIGESGTILHYDGKTWSPMDSGTTTDLWVGIWGSSGSDVFAMGDKGTILHYDGSEWSPMTSGTTYSLESVWGSSGSDVFTVGHGSTILHYDGKAWSDMSRGAQAKTSSPLQEALAGTYQGTTVTVGGVTGENWAFEASIKEFEEKTGIDVQYRKVDDASPELFASLEAGTGPDVIEFSWPSPVVDLARKGAVVDLSSFMDMETLRARYEPHWVDWAVMAGPDGPVVAGLFSEIYLSQLVWYPKVAFDQAGYQVPATWQELLALSDQIVADGGTPWCIQNGFFGAGTAGAPASSWVENIMLRTAPLADYEQWIRGELKSDSPQVRHAVELMSDLWFTPGYSYVSREKLNTTVIGELIEPMLATPPQCWLMMEPNYLPAMGWLPAVPADPFKGKEFGMDYAFFNLPPIDPAYGQPLLLEGHFVSMFRDRPEVRAFMEYFTTGDQIEGWIEYNEGYAWDIAFSPHKGTGLEPHTTAKDRATYELLRTADHVAYDASGLFPLAVSDQFLKSMAGYVAGTIDLDTALQQIDAAWPAPVTPYER